MKTSFLFSATASILALCSTGSMYGQPSGQEEAGYTPTRENMESREQFRDDRLGIFIHWGVYSMLATGEWTMTTRNIDYREYAKLAGGFYPAGFNAEEWVSAIKASGAEYICITWSNCMSTRSGVMKRRFARRNAEYINADRNATIVPYLMVTALVTPSYLLQSFSMKCLMSQMQPMNFIAQSTRDSAVATAGDPIFPVACPMKMKIPETIPSAAPEIPALLQSILTFKS